MIQSMIMIRHDYRDRLTGLVRAATGVLAKRPTIASPSTEIPSGGFEFHAPDATDQDTACYIKNT